MVTIVDTGIDGLSLEKKALAMYERFKGKVIQVHSICCYEGHDSLDIQLSSPALVKVVNTRREDVCRWMDLDVIDSIWDVEPVKEHPELKGKRSFWIYANSYYTSGLVETGDFVDDGTMEKLPIVDQVRTLIHSLPFIYP